jgi:multidrug efflux pump subunit AcrA (membrane-fusion protein)
MVLAVVGLTGASCTQQRGQAAAGRVSADTARPIPVEAAEVSMRELRRTVETVGSFSPAEDAMVSSEVAGQVIDVHVAMGDRVEEGEVMVEVAPLEHELAVSQQKAALDQVRARLGLSDGETTLADIREAATVKRAAADLADAEQKFRRAKELLEEGLLPRQGYEDAEARLKSSQANYDLSLQEVRNLLATMQQYTVASELAEKKLRDTKIRAPFSGFVQGKDVSTGQYVGVNTPVVMLVRTDWVKANFQVPERMAGWVRVGQQVDITVDAYPDRKFTGRITRMNPTVDTETRTFTTLARVENPDGVLKPGFFFRVSVPSNQVVESITIPQKALSYAYGVYSVYVLEGNQVQQREVKIGDRVGEDVEIVSGLTEGERVAISVNEGEVLFAGATVEVAGAESWGTPSGE